MYVFTAWGPKMGGESETTPLRKGWRAGAGGGGVGGRFEAVCIGRERVCKRDFCLWNEGNVGPIFAHA
jgi:hypothetical protein